MVDTTSEDSLSSYGLEFNAVSWDPSDYINFTEAPVSAGGSKMFRIFIDDTDPSRNWSVYAQNYSWCTGSGTFPDPYVIENLYINGNGTAGMIFVENSDKFFIIRDCWFNFSGPNSYDGGVVSQVSSNGLIVNNSFTYTRKGVTLEFVTNTTVDNNIFISDHTTAGWGKAIQISGQSNGIVISNNKIRDYFWGMSVYSSVNITLIDNYIESDFFENYDGNPVLCNLINDTEIIRNVLAGSFAFSSFLIFNSGGSGNTFTNNTVLPGEILTFGPETAREVPKLSQDPSRLISLEDCYNNLVAHNVMLGEGGGGDSEAIYGFDIFILLGMFGLLSVLLVIVKRKKQ